MTRHPASGEPSGFAAPTRFPGALAADDAARLAGAAGDVTLVIDAEGMILDCAVADAALVRAGLGNWRGRAWIDTVTSESREKIEALLDGAGTSEDAPRWRQVNHQTAGGDIPVRYLVLSLGKDGRRVAIGRDMRAAAAAQQRLLQTQQSLERDYLRLRQAEARYRLLFDLGGEPVLIVDAATRRVREANAAAHRLFGAKPGALVDQHAPQLVDPGERDSFVAFLGAAEAAPQPPELVVRLRKGLGTAAVSATPFRQSRAALLLLRFAPTGERPPAAVQPIVDVIERMPDAFVLLDDALAVIDANAAFVELAEMPSIDRLRGERVERWLGRPGIDLELIVAQLREHGQVRNALTITRGQSGGEEEVELSGVAVPMPGAPERLAFGLSIRVVARRLGEVAEPGHVQLRSVEQLTELVGRMSLKEIVRESTDLIERLCIEAALEYTADNRASAAEILGLSRQSLYSKLHRHGLGSLGTDPED